VAVVVVAIVVVVVAVAVAAGAAASGAGSSDVRCPRCGQRTRVVRQWTAAMRLLLLLLLRRLRLHLLRLNKQTEETSRMWFSVLGAGAG
jgi:hypothetical protein